MNTVFIRLEGYLQSWGYQSRFTHRDSAYDPTKSGVAGLVAACLGLKRPEASRYFSKFNDLLMASRVDRQGKMIEDYQCVNLINAATSDQSNRPQKFNEQLSKDYISDGSFLVALQGESSVIEEIIEALKNPVFMPYLGRKCCPPSTALYESNGDYKSLEEAIAQPEWRPRVSEKAPTRLRCVIESKANVNGSRLRKDVIVCSIPHIFESRLVYDFEVNPKIGLPTNPIKESTYSHQNEQGRSRMAQRMKIDRGLCVICQLPASQVHHTTYIRYNNEDVQNDLRSVCVICHDTITSIEYETNASRLDRLDPLDLKTRKMIIERRVNFFPQ